MNIEISREDFSKFTEIATRWSDMDSVGHVNNATFLSYFESVRLGYLSALGFTENKFILASIKIDYFRQLDHPSRLIIGQKISRLGNKSFDVLAAVFRGDEIDPIASSVTTIVCFDYQTQETIPVPAIIRQMLDA